MTVLDACTLPTADQPARVAELDHLFLTAVERVERPAATHLRLYLVPGDETIRTTEDLIARESACCSFFVFDLTRGAGATHLDVRVPPRHVDVLDALARRAEPS